MARPQGGRGAHAVGDGVDAVALVQVGAGGDEQDPAPGRRGHHAQAAVVAGDRGGPEPGDLVGRQVEQHLAQVLARLAPAGAEDDGGVDRRPVARARLGRGEVGDDGGEPLADDGRRRGRGVLPGALLRGLHGSRH